MIKPSKLISLTKGRAFVLFTSFRNMNNVFEKLYGSLEYKMLRQGDRPKRILLEEFKNDCHSILFASNSFWQGVDVQGEALSCVIIDKLPFSAPTDPVVEAKIELIDKNGGNAFMSYQLPSAIILLKQGFRRLIRNKDDTGVLCILDGRILSKYYGKQFLSSLPPSSITRELEEIDSYIK